MDFLNLGCGYRFHPSWTNVNFTSTGKDVIAHNLTLGIPFPDASFDLVYHSHILEHFSKNYAKFFLQECCRVLRPQGVLRVVVPDLEQIARTYLIALEKASSGSQEWAANYEWMLLEMYDQMLRNRRGGEMQAYLSQEHISNEEFIIKRCGSQVKKLIDVTRHKRQEFHNQSEPRGQLKSLFKQIDFFLTESNEPLLKPLSQIYSALRIGNFRQSGEVHQWMYDRYSLSVLLEKCGLEQIVQRQATESYLPDWASFNLDTEPDGSVYKPESLFMEAIKKSE
jgi:predicted SAM-dependent methyltransferase